MGKPGPKKVNRYDIDFKLMAVKLSEAPGVLVQDVAESLCIHPFMLSRWRREVREGKLVGKAPKLDQATVAELQRLRDIEEKYARLQQEHELLKKAIRFAGDRKRKSSNSSRQTGKRPASK